MITGDIIEWINVNRRTNHAMGLRTHTKESHDVGVV